jgi:cyclopropane-fatty-acyl-phospholipid synthase
MTDVRSRSTDVASATSHRVVAEIRQRYADAAGTTPFAVRMPDGVEHLIGPVDPDATAAGATLVVATPQGLDALGSFDLTRVAEAYLEGDLDAEGDLAQLLAMRAILTDRHPVRYAAKFVRPLLLGQVKSDHAYIEHHYENDPDFYLAFLDKRHRAYSQGVFEHPDEPLEDGITRKLDYALSAIDVDPGARVLDIGGGWGAFTEYGGQHGLHVTSLTISEQSRTFVQDIIDEQQLPCEIRLEHFFEHRPDAPYDAIVNLGVTEHLPDYSRTLAAYRSLLKPGGRVYLDASATRRKHDVSTFFESQIYRGNGSPLSLKSYVAALSRSPLELEVLLNDRVSYEITTRRWAENLDAARETFEARWGPRTYRLFRIYLWGCVDGFSRDVVQAYRLVLRNP